MGYEERSVNTATTTISRAAFGVDVALGFGAGKVVVAGPIEIGFTAGGRAPR
ncbi:MAG: hypothetical protein WAM30_18825 [Candidatus Dormiibacterota bacterium]